MTTEYTAAQDRANAALVERAEKWTAIGPNYTLSAAEQRTLIDALKQATATNEKLWGKIAEVLRECDEEDDAKEQERLAVAPYEVEPARRYHLKMINRLRAILHEALPSDYQESKVL